MRQHAINSVLTHLRSAALQAEEAAWTDDQIVARCLAGRDDAAFAALVRRHGPMVFAVCRRVLSSHQDAEDAFQATFLVFLRKMSSIRPLSQVGNWLYGVAYRAALKVKTAAARRGHRERQVRTLPEPATIARGLWLDLLPLLDQELTRLPEKYRVPIVLCDLEGKTRKDAAQQLGWPEGTLAGRLAEGRTRLARRLARLGLPVSGGVLAALMSQNALAAVPQELVHGTLRVHATLLAGGAVPGAVTSISKGVINTMRFHKLKTIASAVAVLALVTLGGALWAAGLLVHRDEGQPAARAEGNKGLPEQQNAKKEPAAPRATEAEAELARLQGTWRKVSLELEGRPRARMPNVEMLYVFEGNRLTKQHGPTGTVQVVPAEKAIIVTYTDGTGQQTTEEYLYELKGNTLRLAHDYSGRPKEFKTFIGSTTGIFTFEREEPPRPDLRQRRVHQAAR
jgi:RNA polymerase sigma-70 factor (ECF subfamily)